MRSTMPKDQNQQWVFWLYPDSWQLEVLTHTMCTLYNYLFIAGGDIRQSPLIQSTILSRQRTTVLRRYGEAPSLVYFDVDLEHTEVSCTSTSSGEGGVQQEIISAPERTTVPICTAQGQILHEVETDSAVRGEQGLEGFPASSAALQQKPLDTLHTLSGKRSKR